jgi:excisionase family DNA binding protein
VQEANKPNRYARRHPEAGVHPLAYKVDHAAGLLDCSRAFVYKLIAAGKLRTVKINNARRIPHDEITRLLEEGC